MTMMKVSGVSPDLKVTLESAESNKAQRSLPSRCLTGNPSVGSSSNSQRSEQLQRGTAPDAANDHDIQKEKSQPSGDNEDPVESSFYDADEEDIWYAEATFDLLSSNREALAISYSDEDDYMEDPTPTPDEGSLSLASADNLSARIRTKASDTASSGYQTAEIKALRSALALVINQRNTLAGQSRAKTSLIRDLLAVLPPDEPERVAENAAKTRKLGFNWMNKRKTKNPTESWYGGWLLGKCEALKAPETAWAVKSSPDEALLQLDHIISPYKGHSISTPKTPIEAKALKAVILRSLDKPDEALELFEEALEDCFSSNFGSISRKIQFLRGQCFSYQGKFAQASFCFRLAKGIDDCYEEMRRSHKKFADEKLSGATSQVDSQGFPKSQANSWSVLLGYNDSSV